MSAGEAVMGREEPAESWHRGVAPWLGLFLAWQAGCAPFMQVRGVEVLRLRDGLAGDLTVLGERGIPHGPVLVNIPRRSVEVFVPSGSAKKWRPYPHTRCVANALMRCPAPSVTRASGRWAVGRTRMTPPGTGPLVTSAEVLAAVLPEALSRRVAAVAGRIEGWAGGRPMPGNFREGQQP